MDTRHHAMTPMTPPGITKGTKLDNATNLLEWWLSLSPGTILVNTDCSKRHEGQTTCASHCSKFWPEGEKGLFEGSCYIGTDENFEGGEIHPSQQGLQVIATSGTTNSEVWRWVDNRNALQALAGGPTARREYIKTCLKDLKILQ